MKNSKREITLNEKDSVKDILAMQKLLIDSYGDALFIVRKKETRRYLSDVFTEICEEAFYLSDVLERDALDR